MTVLILAPPDDDHAPAVAAEIIAQGGQVEILDLACYPEQWALTMRYDGCGGGRVYSIDSPSGRLNLRQVGAVWWRRPRRPQISEQIPRPSYREFAANEASEALAGLWHSLDAFWINDPMRDDVAGRKAYQLRVAQDIGLPIPATLMTNSPDEARSFVDGHGYRNVVYKPFSATTQEWRETRLLKPAELRLLDNVRHAPVIFQEYVEAMYDLRITIIGDKVFPAAIHSQQTDYPVDSRIDFANAKVEAVEIPDKVEAQLLDLVDRLGLRYGAVDMRLTPDGKYVLLEINPAGQFRYIEVATGQPMTATMAALLLSGDRV
jgi:glutathione synthase/RimK-type ligase-like ATP-grasp enzyme